MMEIKDRFLDYLKYELNRSALTVVSYSEDFKMFEEYFQALDGQPTWETIDGDIIRNWMEQMVDEGNSTTTVARRLSALKSLYRFALSHHLVKKDPTVSIRAPKLKKPLPSFLQEEQMDRLLDSDHWGDDYKSTCARTVIMTFYETGIRRAELMGLRDADVDFVNRQLKVTGKGNKQRIIPFGEELAETLRHYMSVRDEVVPKQEDAFFLSEKGCRLGGSQVETMVKSHLRMVSSMKKLSPHVLRHTFATAMLNHGAGIESVRRLLGHASASTTEIYTHTTFEQLKRVYQDAHPRA